MSFLPPGLLAKFESEPVFPDRDSWYWKWVVLVFGCLLIFVLMGAILLARTWERESGRIRRMLGWPRRKPRIY